MLTFNAIACYAGCKDPQKGRSWTHVAAIAIQATTEERIKAFQCVVEEILEQPVSEDVLVELIIQRGLRAMLSDVIGNVEPEILVESIFQMAEGNP